jgi:hypothetical protein
VSVVSTLSKEVDPSPSRPVAFKAGTDNEIDYDLTENPYPTWQKLEEMVEKGKVRNIGISKYVLPIGTAFVVLTWCVKLQHP